MHVCGDMSWRGLLHRGSPGQRAAAAARRALRPSQPAQFQQTAVHRRVVGSGRSISGRGGPRGGGRGTPPAQRRPEPRHANGSSCICPNKTRRREGPRRQLAHARRRGAGGACCGRRQPRGTAPSRPGRQQSEAKEEKAKASSGSGSGLVDTRRRQAAAMKGSWGIETPHTTGPREREQGAASSS